MAASICLSNGPGAAPEEGGSKKADADIAHVLTTDEARRIADMMVEVDLCKE